MDALLPHVARFIVIFARVSAFNVVMPVLGNKFVPAPVKIGMSVFLSILLVFMAPTLGGGLPEGIFPFVFLMMKEVLAGLALGFITKFLFAGVQVAGDMVGRQMGFAMANVMDPAYQSQVSVVAEFQIVVAFLMYLAINGHHFLIQGLAQSYECIPIAESALGQERSLHVVRMASGMFAAGVRIGAPVVVALLMTSVAMGVLARTVPQMNVFIVGLPLRIGIGFVILAMTMTLFAHIFMRLWGQFRFDFATFLRM